MNKTPTNGRKVIIDNKIMQKYGKKIDKLSKKLLMKLKKTEMERVKKARNIEVLTISNLMGEAIKRISNSTSVSDLFK